MVSQSLNNIARLWRHGTARYRNHHVQQVLLLLNNSVVDGSAYHLQAFEIETYFSRCYSTCGENMASWVEGCERMLVVQHKYVYQQCGSNTRENDLKM